MAGGTTGAAESVECRASWHMAIAAVVMLATAAGAPLIIVVGLRAIAADMGGTRSLPALATALCSLGSGLGGIGYGVLAMRIGQRSTAMLGGAFIAAGLLLAAQGEPWQLLVGFTFGVGLFGYSALFAPMVTFVSLWFDRRRGTALALVASGQYVAGVVWPTPFERAIAAYGWQATMLGYAAFCAVVILPIAALVLRPPPAPVTSGPNAFRAPQGGRVLGMAPNLAMGLIAACSFLCCVPMAMPASHLVAFCMDIGIVSSHGAAMLSVLLLAAFISRQFWGWASDRIGGLWTVMLGSIAQTVAMAAFLSTQDEAGLFFIAGAYGLGFGGIIPAYVLAVRALFPASEASWRVPTTLFVSLTGMAFGGWLAGAIYDSAGSYAAAWVAGIAFNLVQLAVMAFLLVRQARARRGAG